MHCYGYPLENTPKQDSLVGTGDLVLFSDAISSAAWTTGSISQSMTFYTLEGPEKEWYKYPALPLVLSKAGYYTYWVSNQEKQGSGIQPIPTLASTSDSTRSCAFARLATGMPLPIAISSRSSLTARRLPQGRISSRSCT